MQLGVLSFAIKGGVAYFLLCAKLEKRYRFKFRELGTVLFLFASFSVRCHEEVFESGASRFTRNSGSLLALQMAQRVCAFAIIFSNPPASSSFAPTSPPTTAHCVHLGLDPLRRKILGSLSSYRAVTVRAVLALLFHQVSDISIKSAAAEATLTARSPHRSSVRCALGAVLASSLATTGCEKRVVPPCATGLRRPSQ